MVDHSKIGKSARRKGANYELKIAKLLKEYTSVNFRRVPASGGFNKRGTNTVAKEYFCGDLISDRSDFLYCIEAKNRKGFNLLNSIKNIETSELTEWWFQACEDALDVNLAPLMFIHLSGGFEIVCIEYNDNLINGIKLEMYDSIVNFNKGSGKLKRSLSAKLPIPYIMGWNEFKKQFKPEDMFGDRSKINFNFFFEYVD